jgi:hypothetical protein
MLTSLKYGLYTFNRIIKISLSKDVSWIYMDFYDKDRGDVNIIWLLFKIFFIKKYIKIIFFLFFKKLFLISIHQNDLKTHKKYINFK